MENDSIASCNDKHFWVSVETISSWYSVKPFRCTRDNEKWLEIDFFVKREKKILQSKANQ